MKSNAKTQTNTQTMCKANRMQMTNLICRFPGVQEVLCWPLWMTLKLTGNLSNILFYWPIWLIVWLMGISSWIYCRMILSLSLSLLLESEMTLSSFIHWRIEVLIYRLRRLNDKAQIMHQFEIDDLRDLRKKISINFLFNWYFHFIFSSLFLQLK